MSSASGVNVEDRCLEAFQELKLKKKYKYLLYKLDDDNKSIILEKAVEESTYDDFIGILTSSGPRYAVYDFEYEKPGEGQRNKIAFYSWTPDDSKVKEKMLYASSKEAIRKRLVGVAIEIQGTDLSEVSYDAVLEKANRSN
ncbi:18001_t:CDS:2 [Funneliformis geosporum]|uniref:Cofilin n=1 Tax=Funneliformis geosporum TaxID=1117311 RepID=A0A9W4SXT2_9GLOM|nr:16222_t:CDS:2 [Funneliformis geosporum]CAI2187700.1 18001_t:CDS:2 [Funneliformis geosporum]